MLSQLACLGVWWISKRSSNRRASCGGNAVYKDAPVWVLRLSSTKRIRVASAMVQTKSGGDSAVRSEFVITGMMFHPRRIQSELLRKEIEQSFVEVTLLPACH